MMSGSWLRLLTAAFVVAAGLSLPAGDALARGGVHVRPGPRVHGHHGLRHHGSFGFHQFQGFPRRPFHHHDRFFHGPFHHRGFHGGFGAPVPWPYGTRYYYPSGVPLSYDDPESGTTYCLSLRAGFYYVCGYSDPAREPVEPAYSMPPGTVSPRGEQALPPPSGMLLFKLPQDAEATVNGVPVRLSLGLGTTAVPPGRYRVVVRASGTETEHTIAVDSHAILTVTPTSVVPADP